MNYARWTHLATNYNPLTDDFDAPEPMIDRVGDRVVLVIDAYGADHYDFLCFTRAGTVGTVVEAAHSPFNDPLVLFDGDKEPLRVKGKLLRVLDPMEVLASLAPVPWWRRSLRWLKRRWFR
jgi:hypothetical protein